MAHIPVLKSGEAPPAVEAVYDDFKRRMSFPGPPNFITTQGHSLAVVLGTWELIRNLLLGGEIPRGIKEMIFVAISRDRQCRYCTAAHLTCCRVLGVSPEALETLVRDLDNLPDPKIRQMIRFAIKCSHNPQSLMDKDYALLSEHGLSRSEVVELIAMSGLAVYANIIADSTAMDVDSMFETTQSATQVSARA